MADAASGSSPDDFTPDATGLAQRWQTELSAAKKALKPFQDKGAQVVRMYLDERTGVDEGQTKWNLFHGNVQQQLAILYANPPEADVTRRFADADDDVARVAGEIGQRCVNSDFEKRGDTTQEAIGNAIEDYCLPGLGVVWLRLEESAAVPVPAQPALVKDGVEVPGTAVPATEKVKLKVCVDYAHWRDVLWSPAGTWAEVSWVGRAADMPKAAFEKRFPNFWGAVPKQSKARSEEEKEKDPWARVRVWELWHKDEGKVYWYVEGYDKVLDVKEDPYHLDGFWPCPRPLIANATTTKLVPRSDYVLAQDLYLEVNRLSTRIDTMQRAIKAAGCYDGANEELKRLMEESCENELIPTKNWAAFAEKGGISGAIAWMPIEQLVQGVQFLEQYRQSVVDALFQVTGQSDIMRGQATAPGETATSAAAKVRFGGVRMQRQQDVVARFGTEVQALKLELVCKHLAPEDILELANAEFAFKSENPEVVQQAVALLKSQHSCYRVEVKPETVSLTDFAQLKQDRTEVISAMSTFFQAAMPVAQAMPGSMPFLLKLLQTALAGLRGSSTMEGVLDGAIAQMEAQQKEAAMQPKPPPQPDPKVQAAQLKMQGDAQKAQADMAKEQFKAQADLQRIQAETVAHDQQEQSQAKWNTREATDKALMAHALKPPVVPGAPKPGGFP